MNRVELTCAYCGAPVYRGVACYCRREKKAEKANKKPARIVYRHYRLFAGKR